MDPGKHNATFVPGDDFVETWTVTDSNGANIDFTGGTITFTVLTAANGTQLMQLTETAGVTLGDGSWAFDSRNELGGATDTSGWDAYTSVIYSVRAATSGGGDNTYVCGTWTIEECTN